MKYLEDSRLTQLTSDLTGAVLNTRGSGAGSLSSSAGVGGVGRGRRGSNAAAAKGGKKKRGGGGGGGDTATAVAASTVAPTTTSTTGGKSKKNTSAAISSTATSSSIDYGSSSNYGSSSSYYNTSSNNRSCRVMYGRVEAYTTKRAGSDKKTAWAVGERYANEMERLNMAVEKLKQRHRSNSLSHNNIGNSNSNEQESEVSMTDLRNKNRRRSNSVGSTQQQQQQQSQEQQLGDSHVKSAIITDTPTTAAVTTALPSFKEDISDATKRDRPYRGILRKASNKKKGRANSVDIINTNSSTTTTTTFPSSSSSSSSTGVGVYPPMDYLNNSNSDCNNNNNKNNNDLNTQPLIPQPSLYQSTLVGGSEQKTSIENSSSSGGVGSSSNNNNTVGPAMIARRLMTDLILTMNASFPDYNFEDAETCDFCTLSIHDAMRHINDKLGEFVSTTDVGCDYLPRFWSALDDILFDGLKDCEVYSYAPKSSSGDDPFEFLTMSMTTHNMTTTTTTTTSNNEETNDITPPPTTTAKTTAATNFYPGVVDVGGGGQYAFGIDGDIVLNDNNLLLLDNSSNNNNTINLSTNQILSPTSTNNVQHDTEPPHVTLWSMNYFFVSRNKKRIVLYACVQTMRTPQSNIDYDSGGYDEYDDYYGENDLVFDEARREEEKLLVDYSNSSSSVDRQSPAMRGGSNTNGILSSPSPGRDTESISMMDDDNTDLDEGSVDGDDVDRSSHDFDTGTMGMSVPSQIAS